jgi:alpha 1,3-glucosidase
MDDGQTYDYRQKRQFIHRRFIFKNNELQSTYVYSFKFHLFCDFFRSLDTSAKFETDAWIERIVIIGYPNDPSRITINSGDKQAIPLHSYQDATKTLIIRRPGPSVTADWTLIFS